MYWSPSIHVFYMGIAWLRRHPKTTFVLTTSSSMCLFFGGVMVPDANRAVLLTNAPENSFLLTNKDGIDVPEGQYYYTDCCEAHCFLQRNKVDVPDISDQDLAVRLGNAFINTYPIRFEIWLTGLLTGNKRPPGMYMFNKDDPPLGMWRVEHRSSNEICLRWNLFGREGRTWLGVTDAKQSSSFSALTDYFHIQLGSAMWPWPFPERRYSAMCAGPLLSILMNLHVFYSRWLLGLTWHNFMPKPSEMNQQEIPRTPKIESREERAPALKVDRSASTPAIPLPTAAPLPPVATPSSGVSRMEETIAPYEVAEVSLPNDPAPLLPASQDAASEVSSIPTESVVAETPAAVVGSTVSSDQDAAPVQHEMIIKHEEAPDVVEPPVPVNTMAEQHEPSPKELVSETPVAVVDSPFSDSCGDEAPETSPSSVVAASGVAEEVVAAPLVQEVEEHKHGATGDRDEKAASIPDITTSVNVEPLPPIGHPSRDDESSPSDATKEVSQLQESGIDETMPTPANLTQGRAESSAEEVAQEFVPTAANDAGDCAMKEQH